MTNAGTLTVDETHSPRRILRSLGAVLAAVLAVFVLSLGTDVVMHATGIYPPWFQPMADSLFLLATGYRICMGFGEDTSRRGLHPVDRCSTHWRSASWALS